MTCRVMIEWAFSIAVTIGIVGITAVGIGFLGWCMTMLAGNIMSAMLEARENFERLKG